MNGLDPLANGYDTVMAPVESAYLRRLRRQLFGGATGRVLELGVGTANNLVAYPPQTTVVGVDESPSMLDRARRKTSAPLARADAMRLPFSDASFDTVSAALVFCSIPDPTAALAEVRRVLRPGGRLLLMEHVRGPGRISAALTDWLDRPWYAVNGSCHLNRDTAKIVSAAGFQVLSAPRRLGGFLQLIDARAAA
jgi:ubiquinone/menaquinone biosynthesis C-methylase UbiE